MLIPAIDLIDGQTVRLLKGDYEAKTIYQRSPIEVAQAYQAPGIEWLHLVDLTGAKDSSRRQLDVISEIIKTCKLKVQVGGGIRSQADIDQLLATGAERVVIGSVAIKQPQLVKQWLQQYGPERIVLALDVSVDTEGNLWLPTDGWTQASEQQLQPLLEAYLEVRARHVLCTDISCDGTLAGSNVTLYQSLKTRYPNIVWQASGGIGSLAHLSQLKASQTDSIILGRALLDGKFTLEEAITCWQNA